MSYDCEIQRCLSFFFFKQKTAYEMRISDWSSDVCSSDLAADAIGLIDVLWLESGGRVAAAFEVEHSTSIYSGIVRMLDLALGTDGKIGRASCRERVCQYV